jgi:hypothetical protein
MFVLPMAIELPTAFATPWTDADMNEKNTGGNRMRMNLARPAACIAAVVGVLAQVSAIGQSEVGDGEIRGPAPDAIAAPSINPALSSWDATGNYQHILPTVQRLPFAVNATDKGPLLYHGGPVMTSLEVYSIFWAPAKLQSGAATSMPAIYKTVLTNLSADYSGHSLSSVASQYYQTVNKVTTYISGLAGPGGTGSDQATYTDADAYPASKCTPTAVNCVTDAQLQAEVARVMTLKGWTGGLTKVFVVYLSPGEETCQAAKACSNTAFCGYHSHFTNSEGATVVYANLPYAILSNCQVPGTPAPSGNAYADTEASIATHEITESITDPEGSAWFTAQGNEIGDLCAYTFGINSWDYDSATKAYRANEMWNGHFYEVQRMFNNHFGLCTQAGP